MKFGGNNFIRVLTRIGFIIIFLVGTLGCLPTSFKGNGGGSTSGNGNNSGTGSGNNLTPGVANNNAVNPNAGSVVDQPGVVNPNPLLPAITYGPLTLTTIHENSNGTDPGQYYLNVLQPSGIFTQVALPSVGSSVQVQGVCPINFPAVLTISLTVPTGPWVFHPTTQSGSAPDCIIDGYASVDAFTSTVSYQGYPFWGRQCIIGYKDPNTHITTIGVKPNLGAAWHQIDARHFTLACPGSTDLIIQGLCLDVNISTTILDTWGKVGVSGPHPKAPLEWFQEADLNVSSQGAGADLGYDLISKLMQ